MSRRVNPGEKLYYWILDRYKRQKVDANSWIPTIAREFGIDEFENFLMKSSVLMLLRRLLSNARWYEEKYVDASIVADKFSRDYLLGTFGFESRERAVLCTLIFNALSASKKSIPSGLYKILKDEASKVDQSCQICGRGIEYISVNSHASFSLDHIWPRSLGGVSEDWNLRVTCKNCNESRKNIVDAYDTHYEHFHVKSDWSLDKNSSFWKELSWNFRIAALIQADFKCVMCDTPVTKMDGGLDFFTIDSDENYHMFNIKIMCGKHRR